MVRRFYRKNTTVRRALAVTMAAVLTATGLQLPVNVYADDGETSGALSWQEDVTGTLDEVLAAMGNQDAYNEAVAGLDKSYSDLELAVTVEGVKVTEVGEDYIKLEWEPFETEGTLNGYNVYFADKDTQTQTFLKLTSDSKRTEDDSVITVDANTTSFTVKRSTHQNWYFKVAAVVDGEAGTKSDPVESPTAKEFNAYLENLDRGLVKVATTNGVFLSWRLLGTEVTGYGKTGLTGADFNVYKDGEKVATVTDSTNYVVAGGSADSTYTVIPVVDGTEQKDAVSTPAILMNTTDGAGYLDIALQKPADTTIEETYGVKTEDIQLLKNNRTDTYTTTAITYSANDVSVGDVDGDGQYEFFVKWDPSLSKDVSQQGYTGKQYIDCYKLDGTLLYRIDLGINIRAGAHYTQFVVYDFNKDGKAELSLKTAPGTKVITFKNNDQNQVDTETYITTPDGESNLANYVFSADDYKDYLVRIFMDWGEWRNDSEDMKAAKAGWDKNLINLFAPEDGMVTKVTVADGVYTETKMTREEAGYTDSDVLVNVPVKDADGNIVYKGSGAANAYMETVKFDDPKTGLTASMYHDGAYTNEEATALADYFLNGYQYRMKKHNLNSYEGYIITGSEYLSLFEGATGKELDTIEYEFKREDDGMLWGDYAMNYIEPGNRCDRFLSTVAYLDGENPYLVIGRGYYTRQTIATYSVTAEGKYKLNWTIDSGWTVMTNPFNDGPHGMDGNSTAVGTNGLSFSKFTGQGDHYVAAADVDSDGKQEIVYGGAIVDDNGDLYSSGGDYLPDGTTWAKYGHGDSIHVADIDPDRPGLEIFSCFEGGSAAPYGTALRDAETNTTIPGKFSVYTGKDTGRCMVGDILPDVRGLETWGVNSTDAKGNALPAKTATLGTNQSIRWSADMTTEIYTGNIVKNVDGTSQQTVLNAAGTSSNNGTKGNAALIADVFGDWREELVVRTTDSDALRIYTNTDVTDHKMYTLMHDTQYRANVAGQNTAYNQPAYLSFYFASDTDWEYVTIPNAEKQQEPGAVENTATESTQALEIAVQPGLVMAASAAYDEQAFTKLNDDIAVLYAKISLMDEASTPLDFDASVVSKLLAVKSDLGTVENMAFIDTTSAEQIKKQAEEAIEQKDLYTEKSMLNLTNALAEVNEVEGKVAGTDVTVQNAEKSIDYWLAGIDTDKVESTFSGYYDFDSPSSSVEYLTPGYKSVLYTDLYSEEKGYGLKTLATKDPTRNRGTGDTLLDDFTQDNTFIVDLPAGDYILKAMCGDLLNTASNTGTIAVNDADGNELVASMSTNAGKGKITTVNSSFKLEKAGQVNVVFKGRLNVLYLEQVVPMGAAAVDVTPLKDYVATIDAANISEDDYTVETYTAFANALADAKALLEKDTVYAQEYNKVYEALENAYKGLVPKGLDREILIDFGTETSPVDTNTKLGSAGIETMGSIIQGLPTMLYADNKTDNGQHFGFDRVVAANETANGGAYFRDYVYSLGGSEYTFSMDLPVGTYYVYMYTGDKASANTTKFYFADNCEVLNTANTAVENVDGRNVYTQVSNGGGQFATESGAVYTVKVSKSDAASAATGYQMGKFSVTLFDDSAAADAITARLNGIEITPVDVNEPLVPDTGAEHEHVFDTEWTTSETEHWHACTAEGCDGTVADKAAHTASEWKIKKAATTSEEGLRYTECTVCGRVLQTEKIAKLHAHVFDKAWTSDADAHWHVCTSDGCDGTIADKAAHTASDWIIDKVATATSEGLKHKECTVCGYRMVEETIAKAEAEHKHTFSDTWSTSAAEHWHACTAEGCDGTVADKAAHTVSDWKVVKEATTQEAGTRQKECTVCGYVVETQSIPKLSEKVNGFDEDGGVTYWYENGVRQGYNPDDADYRGKEIYDSESDAWYWLDAVQEGAITKSKDVYQDSLSGDWGDATNDNGEKIGKWVRYDADGHMVKGWDETSNGTYYFDPIFGTMAKGDVTIDGKNYTFDVITGILVSDENGKSIYEDGFHTINGVDYWYEGGVRQGFDAVDDYFRGKEIYDPASDAWFWLDNIQNGAVAKSKDVYQESLAGQWGDSVNADGEKIGKWVRYDENGHMVKGWDEKDGNTYYFDPIFGTMAKGEAVINGQTYYFDTITGIRK